MNTIRQTNSLAAILASCVVLIAGLKAASSMLTPLLLAIFIALLCNPLVDKLEKYKIPRSLAALITVLATCGCFYLMGDIIASSSKSLIIDTQRTVESLTAKASSLTGTQEQLIRSQLEALNLTSVLSSGLTVLTTIKNSISFVFIVALTVFLALCEGDRWGSKFSELTGSSAISSKISTEIHTYIVVKTITSAATGIVVAAALYAFTDHKYWLLWGILATTLNFIPNIGSFLAATPPMLISLTMGATPAAITLIVYLATNTIIGSYIEPKLIGEKLGLSTLVVFFSMIFFGWMFGIVGMLLSIPITVCIKITLDGLRPNNRLSKILK